jgi:hypothetical protein
MPARLHHIVVDAHDLPGLARFWTQVLGWKVLSEREREIVIGTDENAPVGMCFMPVTDPKTVKNRIHLDLTSSAQGRDQFTIVPHEPRVAPNGGSWSRLSTALVFTRRRQRSDRASVLLHG